MDAEQTIQIFIAIITLLGGFFGIPKLVEALFIKKKKNDIIRNLRKLEKEFENKINNDNKDFTKKGRSLFKELKNNLWKAKEIFKNKEFLQDQLDTIIADLYKINADEKIQEIRSKFECDFDFSERSWAFIAISNMNLYRFDGIKEYRKASLDAAKNSMKKLPNYGVPRAVTLIVYMIDYVRGKEIDKKYIHEMIQEINSGDHTLVPKETYNYLLSCKKLSWGKYVDPLHTLFPKEMEEMKNKSLPPKTVDSNQ